MKFTQNRIIQSSQIGMDDTLKLKDLVNIIQDTESLHLDSLSLLQEFSKENNTAIFLSYRQINLISPVGFKDAIKVETFPFDTKPFFGYRNTLIYNDKNEIIAESYSLGNYVNLETYTPQRLPREVIDSIGSYDKHQMRYFPRKLDLSSLGELINEVVITVQKSFIDYYKHLNNAYYVELAYNQLPHEFQFNTVRCEYRLSFALGEKMLLSTYKIDNGFRVLFTKDKTIHTIIEFTNNDQLNIKEE